MGCSARTTQLSELGDDFSLTNATLVIITLLGLDIALSMLQERFSFLTPWIEDVPLVLVNEGDMLESRMKKTRISQADILHAARSTQGLERMGQIKYAVLERTGEVSILAKQLG